MKEVVTLVDEVIAAFEARRRTAWHPISLPLTAEGGELEAWRPIVEARLRLFRHSTVDRGALLERVLLRFAAFPSAADFAGVADELQEMAREELERCLIDNGMPKDAAHRLGKGYSIGALLH